MRRIWFSSSTSNSLREEIDQGAMELVNGLLMSAQINRAAPKAIIPPPMTSHTRIDPP